MSRANLAPWRLWRALPSAGTGALLAALVVAGAACPSSAPPPAAPTPSYFPPARPVAIRHATLLTATGARIDDGTIVLANGRIAALGSAETPIPAGAEVVDARGRPVTPGLIDTHSHMGVNPVPGSFAADDGNEMTSPDTAEVDTCTGQWPEDPSFPRALMGGVTAVQVLPGSANLIGGRSCTIKLRVAPYTAAMRFPGAPQGLKMACGENPRRVYGEGKHAAPMTDMGNVAGYREAFARAAEYRRKWDAYLAAEASAAAGRGTAGDPPARDLQLETLAEVLRGNLLVHVHCYRADQMMEMISVADEFGFKIRSFHHALEAYKIAPELARRGIAVSTWADWYGFKMEALDGIPENAALLTRAGVRTIIKSDSPDGGQRLNQEAAKAMYAGRAAGLQVSDDEALRWITANPAWALGVEDRAGTLEVGKDADVVLWSESPFSIYALADQVYIDGAKIYDRSDPASPRRSDFELGILPEGTP